MPVSLTLRDSEILDALVHRVRVFSLEQIARTWWAESCEPKRPAAARLALLEEEGLVSSYSAMAHPELPLAAPIIRWRPGDFAPEFGAASYQIQRRWNQPFSSCTCFIATKRAGTLLGGCGGRRSRTSEQTHDIHMAAVFLQYRSATPHLARKWSSEAVNLRSRADRREKLPDAIVSDGRSKRIVEFGGAYAKGKLASFHAYCADKHTAYEVW